MRWWSIPLPAALGVTGAVVLWALGDRHEVYTVSPLATVVFSAGVAGALSVLAIELMRRSVRAARSRGTAEAEDRARHERRRFLLRLDHELRNPVTGIGMALANIESAERDAAVRAVASARTQVDRLGRILADLRKLAELETQEIERMPVDIATVLADVVAAVGELPEAAERTITVHLPQAPWPPPPVLGDPDLLFVSVFNLALNAVKYSRPGDAIELRAHDADHFLVVEVADTGLGIPADEQDQVWHELARGRAALAVPGTGLGLPLVRAIVTRHAGTVSMRSREGKGTVVTIRLPVGVYQT